MYSAVVFVGVVAVTVEEEFIGEHEHVEIAVVVVEVEF